MFGITYMSGSGWARMHSFRQHHCGFSKPYNLDNVPEFILKPQTLTLMHKWWSKHKKLYIHENNVKISQQKLWYQPLSLTSLPLVSLPFVLSPLSIYKNKGTLFNKLVNYSIYTKINNVNEIQSITFKPKSDKCIFRIVDRKIGTIVIEKMESYIEEYNNKIKNTSKFEYALASVFPKKIDNIEFDASSYEQRLEKMVIKLSDNGDDNEDNTLISINCCFRNDRIINILPEKYYCSKVSVDGVCDWESIKIAINGVRENTFDMIVFQGWDGPEIIFETKNPMCIDNDTEISVDDTEICVYAEYRSTGMKYPIKFRIVKSLIDNHEFIQAIFKDGDEWWKIDKIIKTEFLMNIKCPKLFLQALYKSYTDGDIQIILNSKNRSPFLLIFPSEDEDDVMPFPSSRYHEVQSLRRKFIIHQ